MNDNPTETDTPVRDHVYAERQANRAAEAAKDAATKIAEGSIDEAREFLDEVAERIGKVWQYLGTDVIAAGKPAGGAR